ncbi:MAG: AAA family ATPase [Actinomycetota bacterium]|nr:AAA family ATPase [Actinomycetota bacterium]
MQTCSACGADNAAGARFCSTCGNPLGRTCPNCGEAVAEDARFCPACGTALEETSAPLEERKLVTIVFADVTGSTTLGERLDPERLSEVLTTYFFAMREEIEAEGGTVEKFIGDAVMAAFGVPVAHEDDAARALRAALRMQRRLDRVNEELAVSHDVRLRIRIGVNTGEVLATPNPKAGEAMVTGDAVNAAARLETNAEPGQVVVSERTARSVRGFHFEDIGGLELKGKSAPVHALRLTGERPEVPERGVPGLRAPMVGRDTELEFLQTVYRRVVDEKRPNLVTVYGDAGVGKSRLSSEFLAWAESANSATVVRGRCLPYGEGVTYWPLAEILKGLAGVLDSDEPELALAKIRTLGKELLGEEVAQDPVRATAALAYTVGLEDPNVPFRDLEPRRVRAEVHAAWRSFFSALARSGPVVTFVEDIHWADPALLDLLEELAERVEGATLFLCPARQELTATRPAWGGGRRNFSSVTLEPLSNADAQRLVDALLTISDLPPSVHERILARAEGNPFFLEEIIRHLIDEGHIVRSDDHWRATAGIEEVAIPDTVQTVLAARIDLLEPSHKRVLQGAAVVGRVFWPGPLRSLLNGDAAAIEDTLTTLEDRELVLSRLGSSIAGEPEYIFKHILTRDVAYESLPRRERAAAHVSVARWIEESAGERAREFEELLAYHYATAIRMAQDSSGVHADELEEMRRNAFTHLLAAADDARRKLVLNKAEHLARQALTHAASDMDRSLAYESLAETFLAGYDGDPAWAYFRKAAESRRRATPGDGTAVAYLLARACEMPTRWPGSMRSIPGPEDVSREVDLALSLLPEGDSEVRARLMTVRGFWPFAFPELGFSDEDLAALERTALDAADMALRLGRTALASGALDAASGRGFSQGYYQMVVPISERRLALIPDLEDLGEAGDIYATGAWTRYEVGDYREAFRLADVGAETMAGQAVNFELHCVAWRTAARFRLGDWVGTLADLEICRDRLGERRDAPPYFASAPFAIVALLHHVRGESAETERLIDMLIPLERTASGRFTRLLPWMARLFVERGEIDQARSRLVPFPVGWRVHGGQMLEARCELVAAQNAWDEAADVAAEAHVYAEAGGLKALEHFATRLDGRAALAGGRTEDTVELLRRASEGFSRLGAVWEQARTDLDLAEALRGTEEFRAPASSALAVFERLGCVRDAGRARALLGGTVGPAKLA